MKILPATWKASLQFLLKELTNKSGKPPRVAILGVGNQFRSDDGAGVWLVRALSDRECAEDIDHVLIIEAGHAPENATGVLRKFAPNLVLMVDAAEMGEKPGSVQCISEESIDGMSASTHSLPLSMLARYLVLELDCRVALLGIQPGSNTVGDQLSSEVSEAIHKTVDELDKTLQLVCGSQAQNSSLA